MPKTILAAIVAALTRSTTAFAERAPETVTKLGAAGWGAGALFNWVSANPSVIATVCTVAGLFLTLVGVASTLIRNLRQDRRDDARLRMELERHRSTFGESTNES